VAGEEVADRAVADRDAGVGERLAKLLDRQIRCRLQKRQDRLPVSLDPPGPAIPAGATRSHIPLLALEPAPAADARRADPEPDRHLTVLRTRLSRHNDTGTKVLGKGLRHVRRPPRWQTA
jgi:hypothetical protein